ncbi:MAG: potassium/proton antiporter [Kineosporiaceae bacterium]
MTIDRLGVVLLVASVVLLVCVVAVRLSVRSGLPSLLLYLGLGLLLGEDGIGRIGFDDTRLTAVLGYAALVVILAEGGLTTRWESIKPSVAPAALLATVGTSVSIVVTGVAAAWLLNTDLVFGLLVGAVLSSTDAAAVFSVLRRVPLPPRVTALLEAESGFNDAPVVIAVVALTSVAGGHSEHGLLFYAGEAVLELAVGGVVGVAVGWGGGWAIKRVALPASGLYPIAVLSLAVGAYGAAAVLHGSGFLATYLASLVLGNLRLPHRAAVRGFAEGLGWLAQIGLFVLLGLLATPSRMGGQVLAAVAIGLVLLLLARPLSVVASTVWFRVPWRQQVFLSWAGLRGAVPVVLTTIPVSAGLPGSGDIFDLVFVLVVLYTLVQGPTLPLVARVLGLAEDDRAVDLDVEASPLGALHADVLQVKVGPASRMHGVEVFELRMPAGANVTLVVRDGKSFVPTPRTMLRHGDDLIIVVPSAVRRATEERLREISAAGKLAMWRRERPAGPPLRIRGRGLGRGLDDARAATVLGGDPGAPRDAVPPV